MNIAQKIRDQHDRLIAGDTYPQKYRILKDYRSTYIERELQKEEKMIHPMFRVFQTVRPERGRKLNIDPEHGFDPYTDSLMDYPSIIGYKLKKEWNQFNRLISVHLPLCPNNCWYCYVPKALYINAENRSELLTAEQIIEKFLEQRQYDKNQGENSNVLRITGGEPFLLPELIRDCLNCIRDKELENDVFLWTETNLEPFIGEQGRAFMDLEENQKILKELSKFRNFAVHPCFHGLNRDEFDSITGKSYHITIDQQIEGLERLIKVGVDVYPTFGSNVCDPSNIIAFFNKLRELHPNLPLRIALVEYKLDYESVSIRLREEKRQVNLYSRFINFRIWNQLLLKHYGIGYAALPRHFPSLAENEGPISRAESDHSIDQASTAPRKEILYFFKSSYRDHYHREILNTLALPTGHIYEAEYDKEWVPDDLYFHISQFPKDYKGRKIIWSYVNMDDRTILPFRVAIIEDVHSADNILCIQFKLDKYVYWPNYEKLSESTTALLRSYFGRQNIPPGGKFILPGEDSIFSAFYMGKDPCISSKSESLFQIVPHLLSYKKMKKSLFYRITTEGLTQKQKNKNNPATIYEIKGGGSFKIKVDYFLPNYEAFDEHNPEERNIYLQSSSKTITLIGESKIVFTKYGSEELEFITENVSKKEIVTITFWSKYNEFRAAKAIFHIRVLPAKMKEAILSVTGAVLFAIATGGLAMAAQTLPEGKSVWTTFISSFKKLFIGLTTGVLILNILYFVVLSGIFFLLFYIFPRGITFKIKG